MQRADQASRTWPRRPVSRQGGERAALFQSRLARCLPGCVPPGGRLRGCVIQPVRLARVGCSYGLFSPTVASDS